MKQEFTIKQLDQVKAMVDSFLGKDSKEATPTDVALVITTVLAAMDVDLPIGLAGMNMTMVAGARQIGISVDEMVSAFSNSAGIISKHLDSQEAQ